MKMLGTKMMFLVALLLFAADVMAQVPQGFNFQAVARDAAGEIIANTELGVRVTVLQGAEDGTAVYSETQAPTTSAVGSFQIVIGEGTSEDDFGGIDWSADNYYVKLEVDPTGGDEYEELGTTRLLSVPYALLAQDVVNGVSAGEELITEYNLNSSQGDTSFIVNATGTSGLTAIRGNASTEGINYGVTGTANSTETNTNNMFGVYGVTPGIGTGLHLGVLGSAINQEATTGSRYGIYGQAASKAKYTYGALGYAFGAGNGDEGEGYGEGSINFGVRGSARGNTWNNSGLEAEAYGDAGKVNYGVAGLSHAGSTDSTKNHGVSGRAWGPGINYGVYGAAWDGVENYAGYFDGDVNINGNLNVSGSINGAVGEGSANGQTLDSLFIITAPEIEYQRGTTFYPGYIRNTDQDGNFSNFTRNGVQFGNDADEGVFNWISKGAMQVAHADYPNGERATGMNGGYFYMDIFKDGNFYLPLEFGIENASEGGKSYFHMSSLTRAENGQGELLNIHIGNDPNGDDPTGESGQIMMSGTNSPNIQMGGQLWGNNDLPYFQLFGTTEDGYGWYHSNTFLAVASDGTDEWGSLSLMKSNIAGQTSEETIYLDGYSGNINISGVLNQSSDERLKNDIQTIENALDKTSQLRGVTYTWKTDEKATNPQIGVIAQEVEKVFPEFVRTDEDGMKSVNYAQMTAVLIEAVKELNAQIQDLQNENAELQVMVEKQTELENRMAQIEKLLGQNDAPTTKSLSVNTKK